MMLRMELFLMVVSHDHRSLQLFCNFWREKKQMTKRLVESSVKMAMHVQTVASQSKINFCAALCFACAGIKVLWGHFFWFSFLDSN